MTFPDQDAKIIFIHIPKTAGSSFRKVLEREFAPARLRMGHYGYGAYFDLSVPTQFVHLTFLRDPVKRFISEYNFCKAYKADFAPYHRRLHEFIKQNALTLEEYVEAAPELGIDNLQTRYLSMPLTLKDEFPYPQITETHLELALARLAHDFTFTGITERFADSLVLFKHLFDLPNLRYAHRNVTRAPKQASSETGLSNSVHKLLAQSHELDTRLYQAALNALEHKIAALHIDLPSEIGALEKDNRWYERYYRLSNHAFNRLPTSTQKMLVKKLKRLYRK